MVPFWDGNLDDTKNGREKKRKYQLKHRGQACSARYNCSDFQYKPDCREKHLTDFQRMERGTFCGAFLFFQP